MRSAKYFGHEAELFVAAMRGCDAPDYDPSNWCVGIGHDVEREQFQRRWLETNPFKTCLQLPNEQTARALQDYLRGLGLNGDAHGDDAGHPPNQVYVYRHAKVVQ